MFNATQRILAVDTGGRPYNWLHWQQAVLLYARNDIVWEAGNSVIRIFGGVNQRTGLRSEITLNSIVSVRGAQLSGKFSAVPALTNRALFARDDYICMYCGNTYSHKVLTRDHVLPRAQGGLDVWENVITACKACNNRKGRYTPHEAGMPLLAVPYTPSYVEYLMLENRRILADQMDFLHRFVPKIRRSVVRCKRS